MNDFDDAAIAISLFLAPRRLNKMWQKERDTRNAALKTNIALLDEENRDWLIMQLLGVQGYIGSSTSPPRTIAFRKSSKPSRRKNERP